MKYRIVTTSGVREYPDQLSLMTDWRIELRGYDSTSYHRIELRGQPLFSTLLGPMWDGDAVRYEDAEMYRRLSM